MLLIIGGLCSVAAETMLKGNRLHPLYWVFSLLASLGAWSWIFSLSGFCPSLVECLVIGLSTHVAVGLAITWVLCLKAVPRSRTVMAALFWPQILNSDPHDK